MTEEKTVVFQGLFEKAETTKDHGWRLILELNEDQGHAVMQLASMDEYLNIVVMPYNEASNG